MRLSALVIFATLAIVGCTDARPDAPVVQLRAWPEQPLLPAYVNGASSWTPLGFDIVTSDAGVPECARRWYDEPRQTDCQITIEVERSPRARELSGSNAFAIRGERRIVIDTSVTNAYELTLASAHEVGHIILDTEQHTLGGVMGGATTVLADVDYELACAAVGVCR